MGVLEESEEQERVGGVRGQMARVEVGQGGHEAVNGGHLQMNAPEIDSKDRKKG